MYTQQRIEEVSKNGIPCLAVTHYDQVILVSLHGGAILSYQVKGKELLWCTDESHFSAKKAIRGGVPICWPWFGPKTGEPQHGVARTSLWKLARYDADNSSTRIRLELPNQHRGLSLALEITLDGELIMSLVTENTGTSPQPLSMALHSYFLIDHIAKCNVSGLGMEFIDKVSGKLTTSSTPVLIPEDKEMDRIYTQPEAKSIIKDSEKTVIVEHQGHDSVVVWNPGPKVLDIADMDNVQQPHFICVETAVTNPDNMLQAGNQQYLTQRLSLG